MSDNNIQVLTENIPTVRQAEVGAMLDSLIAVGRVEGFGVGVRLSDWHEQAEVTLSGLPDAFRQEPGYPTTNSARRLFTIEDAPGIRPSTYMKVTATTLHAALKDAIRFYLEHVTPAPRLEVVR